MIAIGGASVPPALADETTAATAVHARRARILIGALMVGVLWACLPFTPGLVGALVLCVALLPVHRHLAPIAGQRASAFTLSVSAVVLLAVPVAWLATAALQQAPSAVNSVTSSEAFRRLSTLTLGPVNVGAELAAAEHALVAWVSGRALTAAMGISRGVINLLLALVGLYYLLQTGPLLWRRLRLLLPFSIQGTDRLAERFESITKASIAGVAATSVSQGLTVGLAFLLVGLPNPLFWGVVTGLVSILPILGSSLVWFPGVLALAAERRAGAAITLAVIGFVIASNIDNLILPFVYRRISGTHPMVSLLGAFAGVRLFGIIGLFVGPLALTYCLELYRLYDAEYLQHEPPPRPRPVSVSPRFESPP